MFQKDAHTQLETQHGLTGLRGQIDVGGHDPMVRFNIEQLESALLTGLSSGVLRLENVTGKVVDFGCGRGVSTALFNSYGGDVTGVELDAASAAEAAKLEFVPQDKIVVANGIEHLKSLPPQSLDFVNASMLGPDIDGTLCRDFLNACQKALKPGGVVMVTSDAGTMATIERVNPLNNGFTDRGVFLAVRGVDAAQHKLPLDSLDLGLGHGKSQTEMPDYRELFKDLDLDALLKKLQSEG